MYRVKKQSGVMTIEDYPVGLVGLALLLMAVVLGRIVFVRGGDYLGPVLGIAVPGILVLVAKKRVTRIDRNVRKVRLTESSVFSNRTVSLDTQDISALSVRHGKGRFMHSGLLAMETGSRKLVVSGADILPGHAARLVSLKGMIDQWLG